MQIQVNGVSVFYEQYGTRGPHVLLLHGWGCDTTFFEPITKVLAETMRVTVLDFPGHGKTGIPPEPWGVPEYAEMTRKLIGVLGLAPCHLIGHSFGGRVSLYLGSHDPDALGKIIITGGAGLKTPQTPVQKRRARQYQALKKGAAILKGIGIFGKLPDRMADGLRRRYGSKDYNALGEEMRKTFVKIVSQDLRPLLPEVGVPTLLVWGDRDTETPLWMGETMAKEIPDAGLAVLEGGTHYAYLEQWRRFVRIALHFFLEE